MTCPHGKLDGCAVCEEIAGLKRDLAAALAENERLRKDAERLRAVVEHGWYIVQDIEGDWQVKSPRRYGAPVLVAESPSLHLAIDAAVFALSAKEPT